MPAKPITLVEDVIHEVESWFAEHLKRPPLAHDVAIYNQAYAAVEHLKARLTDLITGNAGTAPAPGDSKPSEPSAADSASKPAA